MFPGPTCCICFYSVVLRLGGDACAVASERDHLCLHIAEADIGPAATHAVRSVLLRSRGGVSEEEEQLPNPCAERHAICVRQRPIEGSIELA